MSKHMITVAVTGSVPTRDQHPGLPHTPAEIADATYDCYRAGAAIVHIHVRDPETGVPTYRLELFRECVERIRDKCDILINLTTSGNNIPRKNVIEERLEPVELGTELCSLDIGSLNLGYRPAVFQNPSDWSLAAAQRMRERGVKPEIEVFDMGHAWQARAMIEQGLFDDPPYVQICMGVRWGIEGTPENLLHVRKQLPADIPWSVLGVGRAQLPLITMAVILGGHVRVGFEDNLYLRKGVLLESNAQMVEAAANIIQQQQGEVATTTDARQILGIN
jgi:3-keto-5-aminohexanoate cleavage enzyme